jgi:hypothetical protein
MENIMTLQVTDEDETLILEFLDLNDLRDEMILPRNLLTSPDQMSNSETWI